MANKSNTVSPLGCSSLFIDWRQHFKVIRDASTLNQGEKWHGNHKIENYIKSYQARTEHSIIFLRGAININNGTSFVTHHLFYHRVLFFYIILLLLMMMMRRQMVTRFCFSGWFSVGVLQRALPVRSERSNEVKRCLGIWFFLTGSDSASFGFCLGGERTLLFTKFVHNSF